MNNRMAVIHNNDGTVLVNYKGKQLKFESDMYEDLIRDPQTLQEDVLFGYLEMHYIWRTHRNHHVKNVCPHCCETIDFLLHDVCNLSPGYDRELQCIFCNKRFHVSTKVEYEIKKVETPAPVMEEYSDA